MRNEYTVGGHGYVVSDMGLLEALLGVSFAGNS